MGVICPFLNKTFRLKRVLTIQYDKDFGLSGYGQIAWDFQTGPWLILKIALGGTKKKYTVYGRHFAGRNGDDDHKRLSPNQQKTSYKCCMNIFFADWEFVLGH